MPIKPETILRRVRSLPECQSRLYLEFKDWLEDEQDPTVMRVYKKSMQVYSYELGNHDRIIYSFDPKGGIELIRVCDHKSGYMKY